MKIHLSVPKGKTLYHVLREKGFMKSAYCGGRGICGKCKVKVEGKEEVSCLLWGPFEGEVEFEEEEFISEGSILPSIKPSREKGVGVALDLGTTGIEAAAFNLESGEFIKSYKILNFQSSFGADVVTRIEEGLKGFYEKERELLLQSVKTVLKEFNLPINKVVVASNPVMHHFFLGYPIEGFARYPFKPYRKEATVKKGKELGLDEFKDTLFVFPPIVGGFVGGDFLMNILALKEEESFLVADLGTNAEIGLITENGCLATSVPAGPAFEGVGLFSGMRAVEGAIYKFFFDGRSFKFFIIGNVPPKGICASAYFDIMATLKSLKLIDKEGTFPENPKLFRNMFKTVDGEKAFVIYEDEDSLIAVTQRDVRKFLLAKGAIYASISVLIKKGGIPQKAFLSGDFGTHLNTVTLKNLKVIPSQLPSPKGKGNLSLKGASLLLTEPIEKVEKIKEDFRLVELATDEEFEREYLAGLEL